MNIAIDFDDTFTADPDTFRKIIQLFLDAGHRPLIVTGREADEKIAIWRYVDVPEMRPSWVSDIPVFCTGGQPKEAFMRKQGIAIDIWVEDCPAAVYMTRVYVGDKLA